MSTLTQEQQYGQAILEHVQNGAYPEAEEIISADIPPSAYQDVANVLATARENLRENIRSLSQNCAPNVDGWIASAKQVRSDAEASKQEAAQILEEAQRGKTFELSAQDAAIKAELLEEELRFNDELFQLLKRLQNLHQSLEYIQEDISRDLPLQAASKLDEFSSQLPLSSDLRGTNIAETLKHSYMHSRDQVVEGLTRRWHRHVRILAEARCIEVDRNAQKDLQDTLTLSSEGSEADESENSLSSIAGALIDLGSFENVLAPFCSEFERLILSPRLEVQTDGTVVSLDFEHNTLSASEQSSDLSAELLFSDLQRCLLFLRDNFPPPIILPMMQNILPRIVSKIRRIWLASAIPESLEGVDSFNSTLEHTKSFGSLLQRFEWPGAPEILEWTRSVPERWLRKRKFAALSRVRVLLAQGFGDIRTVERTETQVLKTDGDELVADRSAEDWNENWSDEGENATSQQARRSSSAAPARNDEDMSAWGLEDEKLEQDPSTHEEVSATGDDESDAWGWGDEQAVRIEEPDSTVAKKPARNPATNGATIPQQPSENTMTLKETYHVTSIPMAILEILHEIVSDAYSLASAPEKYSPIATSAAGLSLLPGLVLTMFRASASGVYSLQNSGNMFLYNDAFWLAEQIRQIDHTNFGHGIEFDFEANTSVLLAYGKRSYAKEMESQRTIITDILDGAQGFTQCTEHPFNQECDIAVTSTVERIQMLHNEWKEVLSRTALLQSLGSLITLVTSKIILDVEDMSDISEPESQQLTKYCGQISALENLFVPDSSDKDDQAVPLTPFYISNWFKFQFLVNILESKLVDIKYLWTESELSLEFSAEEVVDLIFALFADSPYRRNAVAEIRAVRK